MAAGAGTFATRASRRRALTFAGLLALSLLLLAASSTEPIQALRRGVGFALAPVQEAFAVTTRNVTAFFATLGELDRLSSANASLAAQNQQLQEQAAGAAELRDENQQLSNLLGIQSSLGYTTVAATVVGRGTSLAERVVTLDRGSDRGIAVGDVVVGAGGALVGRVYEAGPNYSRVVLISDTRMNVVGMTVAGRATGQVQGQLGGELAMTQIASTATVTVGDEVVTAGIDLGNGFRSPFPKGLLIGQVIFVQHDRSAVVQTALVQPAAPLDQLEFALVITDYEGGLPAPSPSVAASPGSSPGASPSAGRSAGPSARPSATPSATPPPFVLPSPSLGVAP